MAKYKDQKNYFQTHILPVYQRAMVWDDNLGVVIQSFLWSHYSFNEAEYKSKIYIVGSCYEGACSPRIYWIPPVCEVDVLRLTEGDRRCYGEPHPKKVGVYVRTDITKQSLQNTTAWVTQYPPPANSSYIVRAAHERYNEQIKRNPQYYPDWKDKANDTKHQTSWSCKGPSGKISTSLFGTYVKIDCICGWQHHGWPKEAEKWITRKRHWPPQSLVNKVIQQGYQVVRKLTDSTDNMDSPIEYHITYPICERLLAERRTPVQRLVYLMAKTLFYTYLDIQDDDSPNIDFPSYAMKTCMMWLMEQTPVDRWKEDNVWDMLRTLLQRLQMSVIIGYLDNYFMKGANILHNCTPALLEKVNGRICCILSDINKYLQNTKLYEGNVLMYGYYVLQEKNVAYKDAVKKFQNNVLRVLLESLDSIHRVRSTYRHIIEVLEQGTGEGLHSSIYQFDQEQCFHLLKTLLSLWSSDYYTHSNNIGKLQKLVDINLARYMWDANDLIMKVLHLDQNLPEPQAVIARFNCKWKGNTLHGIELTYGCGNRSVVRQFVNKLAKSLFMFKPGDTDVIVVFQGQEVDVCTFSSIGDLVEKYLQKFHHHEADKWMPQIYSLTHRDIPELQLMDLARMLYLIFYSPEVQQAPK